MKAITGLQRVFVFKRLQGVRGYFHADFAARLHFLLQWSNEASTRRMWVNLHLDHLQFTMWHWGRALINIKGFLIWLGTANLAEWTHPGHCQRETHFYWIHSTGGVQWQPHQIQSHWLNKFTHTETDAADNLGFSGILWINFLGKLQTNST